MGEKITKIDEQLIGREAVIEIESSVFIEYCRSRFGIDDKTIKLYAGRHIASCEKLARAQLVENVLKDLFRTPVVRHARKTLSCANVFHRNLPVHLVFRLDETFLRDRVAINKYKLQHPDIYQMLIEAYNLRPYYS